MDRSNGYEAVAVEFLARRDSGRSNGVGVHAVREWARTLPRGAAVIDLGCGPGFPITEVLVAEGLDVFAIDAAPSFVQAFRRNLPNTPVVCEAVQDSTFFHRAFEGALAWGLMFLLSPEDQPDNGANLLGLHVAHRSMRLHCYAVPRNRRPQII
jgi:SAM-dependent methyltransferase